MPEHRPEEGGRLPRSRLGQADDVAPRQDGRDALGLVFLKKFFFIFDNIIGKMGKCEWPLRYGHFVFQPTIWLNRSKGIFFVWNKS